MLANITKVARSEGLPGLWKRVVNRVHFYFEPVRTEWDEEFGVETALIVPISKLKIDSDNALYACHYQPIGAERFNKMMSHLAIDHSRFTFIDIGSGKGKGLLLGANYPFKECIGVEFSPELNAIAENNFKSYSGPVRAPIRSIVQDAMAFEFPESPLVVYFYNPFEAAVIRPVLENLKRSKASPLYVLYYYPPSRFLEFPQERGAFDAAFTPMVAAHGCSIYRHHQAA